MNSDSETEGDLLGAPQTRSKAGSVMGSESDVEGDLLWRQLLRLACVTMPSGSWDKRFVRDMVRRGKPDGMTENQRNQVRRLAYRYRRQMPPALVPDRVQLPPHSQAR